MNTVQRIAKNTGVLLVSQIASYIIGFFFIIQTLGKSLIKQLFYLLKTLTKETKRREYAALFVCTSFFGYFWCLFWNVG
jgi:hypothetical protein